MISAILPFLLLQVIHPASALGPLDNPLKGWCTYTDAGPISLPYSMVFLYVPWSELEPQQGHYAFAAWEKRAWNGPAARGKHVVFRVYIDYPGRPSGLPSWIRGLGVGTTRYSDYGGGESPDYNNPVMVRSLVALVRALGKRYDQDPRVAFIEFGLLGFWGEWHTYPRNELFASDATQGQVLAAAHEAFPHKELMTRYPTGYASSQRWLGFFDDMFPEDTDGPDDWQFLPRVREARRQNSWRTVPFGGEMVPHTASKWLGSGLSITKERLEDAHFTWVGPYSPAIAQLTDPAEIARAADLVRRMGYQFRLDEVSAPVRIQQSEQVSVKVVGVNEGVAPFYYPWPVELALLQSDGRVADQWKVPVDIRSWLPGRFEFLSQRKARVRAGKYTLAIGVKDPWTGKPAIRFANNLASRNGWNELLTVEVQ